jgi:hypothetical protein
MHAMPPRAMLQCAPESENCSPVCTAMRPLVLQVASSSPDASKRTSETVASAEPTSAPPPYPSEQRDGSCSKSYASRA